MKVRLLFIHICSHVLRWGRLRLKVDPVLFAIRLRILLICTLPPNNQFYYKSITRIGYHKNHWLYKSLVSLFYTKNLLKEAHNVKETYVKLNGFWINADACVVRYLRSYNRRLKTNDSTASRHEQIICSLPIIAFILASVRDETRAIKRRQSAFVMLNYLERQGVRKSKQPLTRLGSYPCFDITPLVVWWYLCVIMGAATCSWKSSWLVFLSISDNFFSSRVALRVFPSYKTCSWL